MIKNFENNLIVVMNILNFMNEYFLEIPDLEDFQLFFNLFLNQTPEKLKENEQNKNQHLIPDVNAILFNIILKISFINYSSKIIAQVDAKLKTMNNLDILLHFFWNMKLQQEKKKRLNQIIK